MSAALCAIVGRPNVGKSTLFNRLVGSRTAIVEDNPGVTRDRLYGVAQWEGQNFLVVDTGGLDPARESTLSGQIQTQAEVAMEEADLILFVVDAAAGLTAVDHEIAERLRRFSKPLLVVANKADSARRELDAHEAWGLGLADVFAVSAAHGRGTAELCDAIIGAIATETEAIELIPPGTRIAFLGRPNAGKSTLVNALLHAPRVIVNNAPGTTHDAVYLPLRVGDEDWVLIDTAGLRRRRQVARAQEQLAAIKAIRAMERTEIVVLVVDATAGVTDQDQRIARMAFIRGKGVVVLLHKWDLVAADRAKAHESMSQATEALQFLENPFFVRSSVTGEGRDRGEGHARNLRELLDACRHTAAALHRRISTSDLNEELQLAVQHLSPPTYRGQGVRLYFATQAERDPPLLVISASAGRCLSPAYEKYLLRRFRARWNLRGVPVRIVVRARGRTGSSPRRSGPGSGSPSR